MALQQDHNYVGSFLVAYAMYIMERLLSKVVVVAIKIILQKCKYARKSLKQEVSP